MTIQPQELVTLTKPAQYLGGELNSTVKKDQDISAHIALAFPDTYEVGMSHTGLQILYSVINKLPEAWAERVYMPMEDMEALLRKKEESLFSLESRRPLNKFDLVGFSLQYELCATNILTMLDLAGIEFYADNRADNIPLIIGGGPYSYHPEPLAPFFDAFFLGDAEEAVAEVAEAISASKKSLGKFSRKDVLSRITLIEGIYIPNDFKPEYDTLGNLTAITPQNKDKKEVIRRLLPTLEGAPYPEKPVVPNIKTVHNRLSVEVMRGCVRGCRFCQAGYLYRPQRERSPEEIFKIIETALPQTGYEELSLLSLSTADYCSVVPLLEALMDKYGEGDQLAISFPSTRVDALTPEVLSQVQRVRRTNFTVAPEGGTQRLRDVINKGVSDEQILETCSNVFKMGWTGIKLYFMLGLPTETDEDLNGIIDIARRTKALPEARGKNITVSVSTHVPKPHTPFQWAEQISATETLRKQRLLAGGLRAAKVKFRYHDAFSSFLEGVFARGDRKLAAVIVRAYELGARLDAWTEHLSEDVWMEAFLDCDIDPHYYLRERDVEETLPWEHLSCGIPKSYFQKEWKRALKDRPTPDCLKTSCSICSVCDYDTAKNVLWPRSETETNFRETSRIAKEGISEEEKENRRRERIQSAPTNGDYRIRLEYTKQGNFAFLGHLELVSVFHRAARRSEIPLAYSAGFHPLPRLSFGPPLTLGVESHSEFVDAFFTRPISPKELIELLNNTLPNELKIISAIEMPRKVASISSSISSQRYRVSWSGEIMGVFGSLNGSLSQKTLQDVINEQSITRNANKKYSKNKSLSFADVVTAKDLNDNSFVFDIRANPQTTTPKATEIVNHLLGFGIGECSIEKLSTEFQL